MHARVSISPGCAQPTWRVRATPLTAKIDKHAKNVGLLFSWKCGNKNNRAKTATSFLKHTSEFLNLQINLTPGSNTSKSNRQNRQESLQNQACRFGLEFPPWKIGPATGVTRRTWGGRIQKLQPMAFGVSFHLNLWSQSHWFLFNETLQKRLAVLDRWLRFEIEERTPQIDQNATGCTGAVLLRVANVQGRASLVHVEGIFWIFVFFPLTRPGGQFHCKRSMDLTLEGRDECDSVCNETWYFSWAQNRPARGPCPQLTFLYIRDHCRLFPPAPSPWIPAVKLSKIQNKNQKSTKFPWT